MAIEDWMPTLAGYMAEITGLSAGQVFFPDPSDSDAGLPAALMAFPCLVILPRSGKQVNLQDGGPNIMIHQVQMTLYVAGQVLPEAHNVATPFIKRVRDKIASHVKLGGLAGISHCLPSAEDNFYAGPGGVRYGDKEHLGIIFNIEIKEHETVTVAV